MEYIRRYRDEGRLRTLVWFVFVSAGIAFVEWSLSPQIAHLWVPHIRISDGIYFGLLFALASLYAIVVWVGFFKCGWPALLMLIYAKWGLLPLYFWGRYIGAARTAIVSELKAFRAYGGPQLTAAPKR